MQKQIDKFFIVLGAICLAVFNAVIPNVFLKKTESFLNYESIISRIEQYNVPFKKPGDIPTVGKLEEWGTLITHPLFTMATFQYNKNLYVSPMDEQKKFMSEMCKRIPECDIFITYAPYGTVTVTTVKPPDITVPVKEPKCGKPTLELKDNIPGKIIIKIITGVVENAQIKGFEVYRNDIQDEKGNKKLYLFLKPAELEKIDDNVKPDIEYAYSVIQVCTPTEGRQGDITSEPSEEKTAKAKQKFYITCYNVGTSVSLKIKIKQYEEDGTEKEGIGFVRKNSEIEVLLKTGGKISTGLTLTEIDSKPVKVNRHTALQRIIKYCKMNAERGECEEDSITSLECIFEKVTPKESEKREEQRVEDKKEPEGGESKSIDEGGEKK